MKTTREVLIEARKLIEKPENWSPYGAGDPCLNKHCVVMAIDRCRVGDGQIRYEAIEAFKKSTGIMRPARWNDDPARTHAEVLAAFDRAIAAAS